MVVAMWRRNERRACHALDIDASTVAGRAVRGVIAEHGNLPLIIVADTDGCIQLCVNKSMSAHDCERLAVILVDAALELVGIAAEAEGTDDA